jgi:hypothetical protein
MTPGIYKTSLGRYVIDTTHAIERFSERYLKEGITVAKVEKVIQDGINQILTKHRDREGIYIIHSNSTQIGVVIAWRKQGDPRLNIDDQNHAIVVTLLPLKPEHKAKGLQDTIVTVEQLLTDLAWGVVIERNMLTESFRTGLQIVYITEDIIIRLQDGKYHSSNVEFNLVLVD